VEDDYVNYLACVYLVYVLISWHVREWPFHRAIWESIKESIKDKEQSMKDEE
jgi:hypothetical protein